VVSGAYREEFEQMGAWREDLDHDARYALAEEWTWLVKRLWAEPRVDFEGRFFQLKDCVSDPKPLSRPRPDLICAGTSERGFRFAVQESDAVFVGGRTPDERRDASRRAKQVASDLGGTIKTYAMLTLIHAEDDAAAEALARRYAEGADMAAIINMLKAWGAPPEQLTTLAEQQGPFLTQTAVGSHETCAEQVQQFLDHCELDGLMLIFPDYAEGLTMFGEAILPRFQARPT
jgi:pyrimidine oxygenase